MTLSSRGNGLLNLSMKSTSKNYLQPLSGSTTWLPQLSVTTSITKLIVLISYYRNTMKYTANNPVKLIGPPVSVHLKLDTTPVFAWAQEIPLALRETYTKEIDSKLASGFYERIEHSEWASIIVTKKNGKMKKVTGNYKPTLNPWMVIDEHLIPKAEHIFYCMKGFTWIHLDITVHASNNW